MVRGVLAKFAGSEGAVRKLLIACMALGFASLIAAALTAAWLTRQSRDPQRGGGPYL